MCYGTMHLIKINSTILSIVEIIYYKVVTKLNNWNTYVIKSLKGNNNTFNSISIINEIKLSRHTPIGVYWISQSSLLCLLVWEYNWNEPST